AHDLVITAERPDDRELLAGLRIEAAHVGELARAAVDVMVLETDDVRCVPEILGRDDARLLEERFDVGERHGLDRVVDGRRAYVRAEAAFAAAAGDAEARPAVDVAQVQ